MKILLALSCFCHAPFNPNCSCFKEVIKCQVFESRPASRTISRDDPESTTTPLWKTKRATVTISQVD